MPIIIPSDRGGIDAFAMIVDINGFTKMVSHPEANMMAQFTRDALIGSIESVEKCHGEVVSFMGDAFCSILFDSEMVWECCLRIAKDIKNQTEYISSNSEGFPFARKGLSIKIGIEYGYIDVSDIWSRHLGNQKLFIGEPINYAARITKAEKGNRCLVGPSAYKMGLSTYIIDDPHIVAGKRGEPSYTYYKLDPNDIFWEMEH